MLRRSNRLRIELMRDILLGLSTTTDLVSSLSREIVITDLGAIPDGISNAAGAIQEAIDLIHSSGGGTVIVPAGGRFMTGTFTLRSRVRLHLESGSELLASPDITHYTNFSHLPLFAASDFCRFWIFAHKSEDVIIDGSGTLNANGASFTIERREENTIARNPRAQSVVFLGCKRVRVRGITIRDTPSWALRPAGCEDVLIDGISIYNDLGLVNSDGIDIDCSRNVRVINCHIEAGDDAFSIKGRAEIAAEYGSCEDILVQSCSLVSHCVALRLGLESSVDFRRILITGCTVSASHRGIAIDCRDSGVFEDILFSNIQIETVHSHRVWWHEGEPIYICQIPREEGGVPGRLRRVLFSNIQIRSEQGIYVQGYDVERPEDLTFDQVSIHMKKHTRHPCGFFDPRPNPASFSPAGSKGVEEGTPWGSLFRHALPAFFFDRVNDVTMDRCRVSWETAMPEVYSHAVEAHQVGGLRIKDFRGDSAKPGKIPAFLFESCEGVKTS